MARPPARAVVLAASAAFLAPVVVAPAAADPMTATGPAGTTTVEGEVQRIAVDLLHGSPYVMTVVVPEQGDAVRVRAGDLADVPDGAVARVELRPETVDVTSVADPDGGATVTDVDVVAAASALARAPLGRPRVDGTTRDVHLVSARFDGTAYDFVSVDELADVVSGPVAHYWDEATDGAAQLAVASTHRAPSPLPIVSLSCRDAEIARVLRFAGDGTGAHAGSREHAVLHTRRLTRCPFAGVAHVADGGATWINGGARHELWHTVAHELGHTLTLGHSDARTCGPAADGAPATCREHPYGDAYDVMGFADTGFGLSPGAGPLSGPHRETLGLLDDESSVSATGDGTVELTSVGLTTGTRFLRLEARDATYHVEFRGRHGRDVDLSVSRVGCPLGVDDCTSRTSAVYGHGVVVRRVDAAGTGATSYLLDAGLGRDENPATWFVLPPGRSFTTADGTWTVTPTEADGETATIEVEAGPVPAPVLTDVVGATRTDGAWYVGAATATVRWSSASVGSIRGFDVVVDGEVQGTVGPEERSAQVTLTPGTTARVTIRTLSDGGDRTATTLVVADVEAPVFDLPPTVSLRTGTVTGSSAIPVRLDWRLRDDVGVHQVAQTAPTALARTFPGTTTARGTTVRTGWVPWRLAARDRAGNEALGATYRRTALRGDVVGQRTGRWTRQAWTAYLGGSVHRSASPGSAVTFTAGSARGLALVGSTGPGLGTADVYVDDVLHSTLDLSGDRLRTKQAVWAVNGLDGGEHTLRVVLRSGVLHVDGFVVLD